LGVDDHPVLDRGGARGLELRDPLDLDEAHPASADRAAELRLVAEVGDLDVALLGRVDEHLALRRADLATVDRQLDDLLLRPGHQTTPTTAPTSPTPARARAASMCSSSSPRNFSMIEPTGIAIASPSTHRQLPMICVWTEAMMSRSIGVASPESIRSSILTVQFVPSRQGTHLPHDSWA